TYPAISLAEAREAWRKARRDVAACRNPARVRKREASGINFESIVRDLAKTRSGQEQVCSQEVERIVEWELLPVWGHRAVSDISHRNIRDLIDGIANRGAPHGALCSFIGSWAAILSKPTRLPICPRPAAEKSATAPPVDTRGRTVWVTRARPKI